MLAAEPGLLDSLNHAATAKFLATSSAQGAPNVMPCPSILPVDDRSDRLIFGSYLPGKSIASLENDRRLALLVIGEDLKGWILRGDFIEFRHSSPGDWPRDQADRTGRQTGIIQVHSVEWSFAISRMQATRDYARARLACWRRNIRKISKQPLGSVVSEIPPAVVPEYKRLDAVKVLAWLEADGYPTIVPALSLQPGGLHGLVGWLGGELPAPPQAIQTTACILTPASASYQVKGRWYIFGKAGVLQVEEVFAGVLVN